MEYCIRLLTAIVWLKKSGRIIRWKDDEWQCCMLYDPQDEYWATSRYATIIVEGSGQDIATAIRRAYESTVRDAESERQRDYSADTVRDGDSSPNL